MSFYKTLNSYFFAKPTIIKLIDILSDEENLLRKDNTDIVNGGFVSKRKIAGSSGYMFVFHILLKKKMK